MTIRFPIGPSIAGAPVSLVVDRTHEDQLARTRFRREPGRQHHYNRPLAGNFAEARSFGAVYRQIAEEFVPRVEAIIQDYLDKEPVAANAGVVINERIQVVAAGWIGWQMTAPLSCFRHHQLERVRLSRKVKHYQVKLSAGHQAMPTGVVTCEVHIQYCTRTKIWAVRVQDIYPGRSIHRIAAKTMSDPPFVILHPDNPGLVYFTD